MKQTKQRMRGITRRDFLAAGSAAAVVGMAAMAGCSPQEPEAAAREGDGLDESSSTESNSRTASWENAPEPIAESAIVKKKEFDVVVVGAGMSGVCAALAAAEKGATVGVVQKGDMVLTHGTAFAAINTADVLAAGNEPMDVEQMMTQFNLNNSNNINFKLLQAYFAEAVESGEWFVERVRKAGLDPVFQKGLYAMLFTKDKAIGAAQALADQAKELGVEFLFDTPGVQLVKDGARIVGVIAGKEGSYVQCNGTKGVVLATGCYGNNDELKEKFCPGALPFPNFYAPANNDGDGHLMGMWAGALMQQRPHPKMNHVHHYVGDGDTNAPMRKTPWLNVNDRGERIMNEAVSYEYRCNATYNSPERHATQLFDATFEDQLVSAGSESDIPKEGQMEQFIKDGFIVTADTIEGIAQALDIPAETLVETVARYNELAAKGHDDDFLKPAKWMMPIETPPFYAIRRQYTTSAILGGLQVGETSNVLDEELQPIPGLYAVGNVQGGMFGDTDYTFDMTGLSLGRAMTFGYMVGRDLATV